MKKFAVTGHSSGIGKAIYEFLNPNCDGMSRSNGYDISNFEHIVEKTINHDVFINNAYERFFQCELLLSYFMKYKNHNKTIINIGSSSADVIKLSAIDRKLEYQIHKKALKSLCQELQTLAYEEKYKIKVLYVTFGYVGTERILKKHTHLTPDQYITEEEAVRTILKDVF